MLIQDLSIRPLRRVSKRAQLSVAIIFILFFLSGCGTVGKDFNSSYVKSIRNNITNQTEILEKFGLPFKEGIENGQIMWTYQLDQWNIFGPAESKDLLILFDEKNIVRTYRYTTSELE